MSCCGQSSRPRSVPPVRPAEPSPIAALLEGIVVAYLGAGALSLIGEGTGSVYSFSTGRRRQIVRFEDVEPFRVDRRFLVDP